MLKYKELLRQYNFREVTKEESELNRPDYCRFNYPERYMTEEELKYFKSDSNRKLFKEMYWGNKNLNEIVRLKCKSFKHPESYMTEKEMKYYRKNLTN